MFMFGAGWCGGLDFAGGSVLVILFGFLGVVGCFY